MFYRAQHHALQVQILIVNDIIGPHYFDRRPEGSTMLYIDIYIIKGVWIRQQQAEEISVAEGVWCWNRASSNRASGRGGRGKGRGSIRYRCGCRSRYKPIPRILWARLRPRSSNTKGILTTSISRSKGRHRP